MCQSTEHFLIFASAFLFPPLLIIVCLVIVLATFGKSVGLRQKYVNCLIAIFEWGARQIHTTAEMKRKEGAKKLNNEYGSVESDTECSSSGGEDKADRKQQGVIFRRRRLSGSSIIFREANIQLDEEENDEELVKNRGWAVIRDSVHFVKAGLEAIIEDDVTSRFEAEQLATWNMLTRTSVSFCQFVNWKLTTLWVCGFLFRYLVLFPLRLLLFSVGFIFLIISTAGIGVIPDGALKRKLNEKCMLCCHRILSRSLSAVVVFHNQENKAKTGGICVANHTSPIDVMILGTDNVYALVGQRHPGLLGLTQRALSRASAHIWFERNESKDRAFVAKKLKEHVDNPHKLPILIFPEGTCINNTSVMMFKKGSFEVGTTIYPIAMKYDSRFGDAFWNSSEQGWFEYIVRMMTSWAIICEVWYLPPMKKLAGEGAIEFANRVKKEIAIRGGLVDLEWDGGLKRSKVPMKMVAHQQEKYFKRLSRYTSCCDVKDGSPDEKDRIANTDGSSLSGKCEEFHNSLQVAAASEKSSDDEFTCDITQNDCSSVEEERESPKQNSNYIKS